MLVSFSSDICLLISKLDKVLWQTSLSWMTTTTRVYMLGPSQEIQVIACLDINSIFGIRRIGSFQLLMFPVEHYHTFCNALTAGTLQIAYGYPLVIIWLLAHVFISLLPFPLLNINFSIELNKWFLKLFSFLGHSEAIWLIIWWSPLIRLQELYWFHAYVQIILFGRFRYGTILYRTRNMQICN